MNFVSVFIGAILQKKIKNQTGYGIINFDFTLHHLANKSAAIVVPFPELGVVVEIKHVRSTKRTESYCFVAGKKMISEGQSVGVSYLFKVEYLCCSCHFFSSLIILLII